MPRSFSARSVGDIASRGGLSGIASRASRAGRSVSRGRGVSRDRSRNITWLRGYSAQRDIDTERALREAQEAARHINPREDREATSALSRAIQARANFVLGSRDHPEFAAHDRSRRIGEGILSIAPSLIGGPVLGQLFSGITGRGVAGALTGGGVFGRLGDPGAVRSFRDLSRRLGLSSRAEQADTSNTAPVIPASRARGYGRRGRPDWLLGDISTRRTRPSYFSLLSDNLPH